MWVFLLTVRSDNNSKYRVMKLISLLIFLFSVQQYSLGQKKGSQSIVSINTSKIVFNKKNAFVIIQKAGIEGRRDQFDTLYLANKAQFIYPKLEVPIFADALLYENNVLIAVASTFILTNTEIEIVFNKPPNESKVIGGENEYYSNNRLLYLSMPAKIAMDPAYKIGFTKKSYDIGQEFSLLSLRYKEYENSVKREIASHRNYFYAVFGLFQAKDNLTTRTLEECFSLFPDTLKNTYVGKSLKEYITNAKKLFLQQRAPDFTVLDNTGKSVESNASWYEDSELTLIEFWASWCIPCRQRMKAFKTKFDTTQTTRFKIIAVSIDEEAEDWLNAIKKDGYSWTNYRDPLGWKGQISKLFNLTYIPANILLDKKGNILARDIDEKELGKYYR